MAWTPRKKATLGYPGGSGVSSDRLYKAKRTHVPVTLRDVKRVQQALRTSDLVELLTQWRLDDGWDPKAGGRRSFLSFEATLTLLLLLALEGAPLHVTDMARIIHHRLMPDASAALGVDPSTGDFEDWKHRTNRAMRRILAIMDPHPETARRRRLLKDEFYTVRDSRDPAFVQARLNRLHTFGNALIAATVQLLPEKALGRWKGDVAIDGTFIRASRTGTSEGSKYVSSEPDAGWHVRNHEPLGDSGKGDQMKWGFELHIVTSFSPGDEPDSIPNIILGFSVDRPGFAPGGNALKALHNHIQMGLPRRYVVTDMLYFPGMRAENYAIPLRRQGFLPIGTQRKGETGLQDEYKGALLVDGNWYSPGMPQSLIDATTRLMDGEIDVEMHKQMIQRRAAYLLHAYDTKPNGGTKLGCPALGSPSVSCPTRQLPISRRGKLPRVTKADAPDSPNLVCTQTSVTAPVEAGAKYALPQNIQWGTEAFRNIFSHGRNTIESTNARLKAGNGEMIEDRTRRMMRGTAAHSLFSAVLLAVHNVRAIEQYAKSPTGIRTPKKRLKRADQRRAVDVLEENLIEADPPHAPPLAA